MAGSVRLALCGRGAPRGAGRAFREQKKTRMRGVIDRAGVVGLRRPLRLVLLLSVLVGGCGEVAVPASAPADTPAEAAPAQPSIEDVIAAIQAATPNPVTPEQVAETFAFGTRATNVQREMMEKELVGSVVEWDLVVFEVAFADGRYKVTSQPIPIQSARRGAAGVGRGLGPGAGACG